MGKRIWKLATLALTAVLATGLALAQDSAQSPPPPSPPQATQPQAGRGHGAGRGLGLTVEQRQQMRAIRQDTADKIAVIRNDSTLSDAQKQEQIKALRASAHAQGKAILTPEQQAKTAQFRQARQQSMQARLGLTDDQSAKLQNIFTTTRTDRQATLKDPSLTQEQKLAKLKSIRENMQTQLKATLTPEQLQKMQQMRSRGKRHGGVRPMARRRMLRRYRAAQTL